MRNISTKQILNPLQNSLAHAQHSVNLLDTKPVENVRHQGLETHVLDASDVLSSFEIFRSTIRPSLSGIVDEIL